MLGIKKRTWAPNSPEVKAMKVDFNFIIYASATFLTEHLPVEAKDWDKDKLNKFLTDHAYEPFEFYSSKQIWEQIITLAKNLEKDFDWKDTT